MTPRNDLLCRVEADKTLLDALRAVDRGSLGIALVVDQAERLIGLLTDGDIRRALLAGQPLDAPLLPHANRSFVSVGPSESRAEVLDLMNARTIHQLPIVDAGGRVLGIHLLHEVVRPAPQAGWAVIMAGGKGTRLGALTRDTPKPMLRVAGRPILERIVLHLAGFGFQRIFLSINYLGHIVEEHFGDGSRFGCRIEYLREEVPLGTGGALALLPERPSAPLLVMNGDLVTQADFPAMIDFHGRGGHAATVGVRRYFHSVPFGCLEVEGGRVKALEEKPTLSRVVNAGMYVLSPDVVARVPVGQEFPLPALLEQCIARGEAVGAFEVEGDWIDVGQREQLKEARGES